MSKGFLLDTVEEQNILAPVPADKIWLFASEKEGVPVLKGKLPDGSILTFSGSGETPGEDPGSSSCAFYQCASVDYTSGTWSGYKWDLEDGIYVLSTELTEGLTVTGITPTVGGSYSADTTIKISSVWQGSVLPKDGLVFHAPLHYDYTDIIGGANVTATNGSFIDNALRLNKTYASWGGNENIPSGTSAMSIAGRVLISSVDDAWTYFFGFSGGSNSDAFGLNMEYSSLAARIGFDWKYLRELQTNVWYVLVLTRSETGTVKAYVDGTLVGTTQATNSVGNSIITVGANGGENYGAKLNGSVSDFLIYNKELTTDEIADIMQELNSEA